MMVDPTTQIGRMRLLTGDIEGYFEDDVYQHQLDAGLTELEGAIEVMESLVNVFALMPARERAGAFESYNLDLAFLSQRLEQLKAKRYNQTKAPIVINAGQESWDWLDSIYGRSCK